MILHRGQKYLAFRDARELVRNLGLKNAAAYRQFKKSNFKYPNLPAMPERIYKLYGWVGWEDFLDYRKEDAKKGQFLCFEDARLVAHCAGITSSSQWREVYKKFKGRGLPANPASAYADSGWNGWEHFLEKENSHILAGEPLTRASLNFHLRWVFRMRLLEKFKEINGRWPYMKESYKGKDLGSWTYRQRKKALAGELEEEKIKALKSIGFEIKKIRPEPELWLENYNRLKKWKVKHPDDWPKMGKGRSEEEFKLAKWVAAMKQRYKGGTLSSKQIRLLRTVKFPFRFKTLEDRFEQQFNHLKKFREKYPDRWPKGTTEFPKGNPLGKWCMMLRGKRNEIADARKTKLYTIGFPFSLDEARWLTTYGRLKKFIEKKGRLPTSRAKANEEFTLYTWISRQKRKAREGEYPDERRKKLKTLGLQI